MNELTTRAAREGLSEAVNRAAFGHERIVLTRRGKKVAALVSIADLEQLELGADMRVDAVSPADR